jgi:hypothetical protein
MNSGYEIPMLGYGVYQTYDKEIPANFPHNTKTKCRPANICEEVVTKAFEAGYRHASSRLKSRAASNTVRSIPQPSTGTKSLPLQQSRRAPSLALKYSSPPKSLPGSYPMRVLPPKSTPL